jgi:hypothetical protein
VIRSSVSLALALLMFTALGCSEAESNPTQSAPTLPTLPPFSGTIFIDPDIITPADPSTYVALVPAGQDTRVMFDRRAAWITTDPFLFDATYDDGLTIEVQVNPEFGSSAASQVVAEFYAEVIGRLPTALRIEVETVWIHKGIQLFGGGNNNLLIHVGQGDSYIADGILEETLMHESVHTSLDAAHATAARWMAAQDADPAFISTYARDFPFREDLAESFVPYFAAEYRSDRISESLLATILETIPNRIDYFSGLGLDMFPIN